MHSPVTINSGIEGPKVLITAGVHGDEYEPILAAHELISVLTNQLIAGSVTIVPIVNTSAAAADNRLGTDGLDLARICPGNMDGSSSEISAALVSELIKQTDYYIDLHTGGKIFNIYPLAGYMLHTSKEVLEKQQQMAIAFNLPVVWGTDSAPNGRTLSVARDANVPSIYVEFGGGASVKKEIIIAYTNGCLNVLQYLNLLPEPTERKTEQVKYIVEDHTPNNGHLQAKLPAPCEGIFVPEISPGQSIKKDQLWGTIIDVPNNHTIQIFSDQDGIVLFLREAAYVKKGDSLGGILPVDPSAKLIIHGK